MKKITLLVFILLPVLLLSQTQTENYIKTTTYKVESTTVITNPTPLQADQNITYFDGLNRPVQQIAHQQSGSGKDIVTPIEYDAMGRQEKNYLPYVPTTAASLNYKTSALTDLGTFYNTAKYENTSNPYSQKEFEASPLNRILKQASPGTDWALNKNSNADHTIKFEYGTNTSREVKLFSVHLNYVNGVSEPQLRYGQNGDAHINPTIQTFNITVLTPDGAYSFYCDENVYILDAAEDAGLDLPYSDRKGASSSSLGLLVSGCIDNSDQTFLTNSNLNVGLFTYDVAYPRSDVIFFSHMEEEFGSVDDSTTLITYGAYTGVSANRNCGDPKYALPYYNENELYKTVTKDENWQPNYWGLLKDNTTEEFKNKQGQVVLKRTYNHGENFDTYYVYDDYGNLTYVIPPKVNTKSFFISNTDLEGLCYQYKYDNRNRLVEKKLPGKEWEYIVYDKLDRPVLTQDANLRTANKWLFTKYDQFSRPVYTGEYVNTTQITRVGVQGLADASTIISETKQETNTINGTTAYYSNDAFPDSANINLLTINYYDDYNFDLNDGDAVTSYDITPITYTKGLTTGSKVRILDTNNWITNSIYYDVKKRPIYSYSKNDYLGTTSTVKSQFDFEGKILETTSTHIKNSVTTTIVDSFTYDQTGRIKKQTQAINGNSTPEIIVANSYDELGQLISKNVGGKTNLGLQKVDYTYNIRGWLKSINDPNDLNLDSDLFGFRLYYNVVVNPSLDLNYRNDPLYNGNISSTTWKTNNHNTVLKQYNYTYDALNRFKHAIYYENNVESSLFNESIYAYDRNGNILNLYRGKTNSSDIDNLFYSYDKGNRLINVTDRNNNPEGFKNGTNTGDDYSYDANGNMIIDHNKGITSITYNHLNLPKTITFNTGQTIDYKYDATGVKQRKIVSNGITTDYAGGFQYENNILKFFPHPEGYVEYNNNTSTFSYVYQYKDQLGNIRLSYKDVSLTATPSLQVLEENSYYPFGLKHKDNNVVTSTNNPALKYKYNGKELQEELGLNMYDYGARKYDPILGRWMNMDPLSEKYETLSPYNYVSNNPINAIDPDGKLIVYVNGLLFSQALEMKLTSNDYKPENWGTQIQTEGLRFNNQEINYWDVKNDNGLTTRGEINRFFSDDHNVYVNGSHHFRSQASERFEMGKKAGNELIAQLQNGTIELTTNETIKIVGHSQGAAHAAGMLTQLLDSEYSNRLEAGIYLSPHQPGDFKHPDGVFGAQFSTKTDRVSSRAGVLGHLMELFNGSSELNRIEGSDYLMVRPQHKGNKGGHDVESWNNILKQMIDFLRK